MNNANRPVSAYNVPVTILDPGPDGVLRTADDGPALQGFNLSTAALALPVLNELQNTPGPTFLTPSTIVPPRIARVGVKFD